MSQINLNASHFCWNPTKDKLDEDQEENDIENLDKEFGSESNVD